MYDAELTSLTNVIIVYNLVYRVYQKKVDKSETALYFVKRFNVRTFLLK